MGGRLSSADFLGGGDPEWASLEDLVQRALVAGVDVVDLSWHLLEGDHVWVAECYPEEDLAELLIALLGREGAQRALQRTALKTASAVERHLLELEAERRMLRGGELSEILGWFESVGLPLPTGFWEFMCRRLPLATLVGVSDAPEGVRDRALRRRASPLGACLELEPLLADVALSHALRIWCPWLGAGPDLAPDLASHLLGAFMRLHKEENRSLWEAVELARRRWPECSERSRLTTYKRGGLSAVFAALALIEEGRHDPGAVVGLLLEAGYELDEVAVGLLENGFGPRRSLDLLSQSGEEVRRIAAALLKGELAASQVREELRALGMPDDEIRGVLHGLVPDAVLALVAPVGLPAAQR